MSSNINDRKTLCLEQVKRVLKLKSGRHLDFLIRNEIGTTLRELQNWDVAKRM